jgi:hypothetical protein
MSITTKQIEELFDIIGEYASSVFVSNNFPTDIHKWYVGKNKNIIIDYINSLLKN